MESRGKEDSGDTGRRGSRFHVNVLLDHRKYSEDVICIVDDDVKEMLYRMDYKAPIRTKTGELDQERATAECRGSHRSYMIWI